MPVPVAPPAPSAPAGHDDESKGGTATPSPDLSGNRPALGRGLGHLLREAAATPSATEKPPVSAGLHRLLNAQAEPPAAEAPTTPTPVAKPRWRWWRPVLPWLLLGADGLLLTEAALLIFTLGVWGWQVLVAGLSLALGAALSSLAVVLWEEAEQEGDPTGQSED